MKSIYNYYFKRNRRIKRIENDTYVMMLAIGLFLGSVLSEYISAAHWVGMLMVILPMNGYQQYKRMN